MTTPTTEPTSPQQPHPLLFDACRCSQSAGRQCLACARWLKHYGTVTLRRRAWKGKP